MTLLRLEHGEHPGVRILTLDDPHRRNALSAPMRAALTEAVDAVRSEAEARVLVVAGTGPAFCAGADLREGFGGLDREVAEIRADLQRVYASFLSLGELRMPTIAAVQGPAVGAGLNLALSCDLRIAGPNATFSASFTRIGLHPGGGCTYFLVRELGAQRAMAMLLDGGQLDAAQAVEQGLVLRVSEDPLAEALRLANRYAALDPGLVRDVKRAVQVAEASGLAATLDFEAWAQASSVTTPAVRAAIARYARAGKSD